MTIIRLRRGTAAAWTSANPILAEGEPGVELDTGYEKIGDGTHHWTALPYTKGAGAGGSGIVEQDDPPSDPSIGDLWIDTNDPGPSGASTRFLEVDLALHQSVFSMPTLYFPIIADPVIGPVFSSLPFVVGADTWVAYSHFKVPNDGGAAVTLNYVELTVTNMDGTQMLCLYTTGDLVVAADGTSHAVATYEAFGGDTPNENGHAGTDLTLENHSGTGAIHTTAGGVFVVQLAFDITPPA